MQKLIPRQYYRVTLQVAGPPEVPYLSLVESGVEYRIGNEMASAETSVNIVADAEWLPFAANSIDLLVLSHVLEFSSEPHDVLREVSQCAAPEGIVAICGFNPHSMLGMRKSLPGMSDSMLQQTRLYSVLRVRDWMSLLGFDSLAGEFAFFRPPAEQAARLARMERFEAVGNRWWPGFGSVYVLVFRKKVFGGRVNGALRTRALHKKRKVLSPVVECNRPSD